jgi:glutamate racemase
MLLETKEDNKSYSLLNTNSIGIFDSGIGGLTVASAISKLLPNEKIIYFGDTEHMPYGEKSSELVQEFSIKISNYLVDIKKCKALVIACNTASAMAYSELKETYLGRVPVINVIDPMIELVVSKQFKKLGIIATRGTVSSKAYQNKLKRRCPDQKFSILATPLLASMIEENFIADNISRAVIKKYLSDKKLANIDALILACTHYPLIAPIIDDYFQGSVQLLKSGDIVAQKLKLILQKENLLNSSKSIPDNEFIVSDLTKNFEKSAKNFYGKSITLKEVKL